MALVQFYTIRCENLPAADKGLFHRGAPSSDPFCVFSIGTHEVKTKPVPKDLNPHFEDNLHLEIPPGEDFRRLVVKVFDHDLGKPADPLGMYSMELPASDTVAQATGVLVSQPKQKVNASGTIYFSYAVTIRENVQDKPQDEADAEEFEGSGSLIIERLSATGVTAADRRLFKEASSDPYCIVYIGSTEKFRTKVLPNTLNPDWTPTFTTPCEIPIPDANSWVKFVLFDRDVGRSDDFLGEYTFQLTATMQGPKRTFDEPLVAREADRNKKVTGRLQGTFTYRAPADVIEQFAHGHVRFPPGAFGRLVIRDIECRGLRAADKRLLRANSSDPYVDLVCRLKDRELRKRTGTIKSTLNPTWPDVVSFWVYERNFEVVMEVFDEDLTSKDDSLGVYRFEIPDVDTMWTKVTTEELGIDPKFSNSVTGTISFEYTVQFDEELEWSSSFGPIPKAMTKQVSKKVIAKFKPLQTQDLVNQLMEVSNWAFDVWAVIVDIVMWKHIPVTFVVVLISLYVSWRSYFFQTLCAGLSSYMGYFWFCNLRTKLNPVPQAPPPPPPPPPTPEEGGGGFMASYFGFLGVITQWAYMGVQTKNMVVDIFTWADPLTTHSVALGFVGLFLMSWVIPVSIIVLLGLVYAFTVQAFHWNYPLFARRFPGVRLVFIAIDSIMDRLGMGGVTPWHGTVRIKVIEAKSLMQSEKGHIGSIFGKASYPDPFVCIAVRGETAKTKTIKNTVHPRWDQDLEPFDVDHAGQKVIVQVWDENNEKMQHNSFLGETSFRAIPGVSGIVDTWLPLSRRSGVDDINVLVTGHIHLEYEIVGGADIGPGKSNPQGPPIRKGSLAPPHPDAAPPGRTPPPQAPSAPVVY